MRQMQKRVFSTILALVLVFSLMPVAFAETTDNCDGTDCSHEAAIGSTHYDTLAGAAKAAVSGDTVELLKGISNPTGSDGHQAIKVSLPAGVTLDGQGKTISGDVCIYVNAAGGTVQNVKFENIHNDANKLSPVYASGLTGTLTVRGCEFDTCDWDAIQTTPKAGAVVDIQGNTFRNTGAQGINTRRYIHVESAANTDFTVTVSGNKFYDGSKLQETAIEVYYPTDLDKITLSGNYMAEPMNSCILIKGGISKPELVLPFRDEALTSEVWPEAGIHVNSYNYFYYPSLQDAIDTAENDQTITLLGEIRGNASIPAGKTLSLKSDGQVMSGTLTNNGTLKITSGGPYNVSKIVNRGTILISGGTFTAAPAAAWMVPGYAARQQEDGTYQVVLMGDAEAAAAGYVARYSSETSVGRKYYKSLTEGFAEKGALHLLADVREDVTGKSNSITLYCDDYTFTGGLRCPGKTLSVYTGTAVLTDMACEKLVIGSTSAGTPAPEVTVKGGAAETVEVRENGKLTIEGGAYSGGISVADGGSLVINGGYFVEEPDPAAIADGKAAVPGTYVMAGKTYNYMVREALPENVEVAEGKTEAKGADEVDEEIVEKAAGATASGLSSMANDTAGQVTPDEIAAAKEKYNNEKGDSADSITLVIVPRLDIEVAAYDVAAKELTLGIEAIYDVKATTATDTDSMTDENTVTVSETSSTLDTVGREVQITIPLPDGFVTDTNSPVYVDHIKGSKTYVYKAVVAGNAVAGFTATFTNPDGFSTFILTTSTAASITDEDGTTIYYDTLAEAVSQVKDGQTIQLEEDNGETVTVERDVTFVLDPNGKTFNGEIRAGSHTTVTKAEADGKTTYTFDYTSSSSGYAINITKPSNGTVSANVSRAGKGTEVVLTVQAKEGYALDTLTVTDKNGDELKLTDKGDGKYSFTMPASGVTVTAVFTLGDHDCPFEDVSSSHWFHDAVHYVQEAGLMNGVGEDLFAPDAKLTRGMMMTILARLDGADTTGSQPWYQAGLNWAVTHGVSDGSRPEAEITREQLATMLWRYAGSPESKASLDAFTDADAVSDWAATALAWATAQEIVTGRPGGILDPAGTATRAEAAQMLMRFSAR